MHNHHSHNGHTHQVSSRAGKGSRALLIGLLLTLVFALVELSGGWLFGSLALMSDAGHMFSDSAALLVAVIAAKVALKPPGARHSYGFARAEAIAASFNGLLLLGIVVLIVIEAIERLQQPQPVSGFGVLVVAFLGLPITCNRAARVFRLCSP